MPEDKVPTSLVEKIMDRADKETAKELSNVETIVATLVTQLNTPPRVEDVNRLSIEIKSAIDGEVVRRLGTLEADLTCLTDNTIEMIKNVKSIMSKVKWIAGIIITSIGIAMGVISYVTNITEKTIQADTAVQIKAIEEKYEAEIAVRKEEFKKLMEEIQRLRPISSP